MTTTPSTPWSAAEDTLLRQLYPNSTNKVVGKMLGRTADSVKQRAKRLRLRKHDATRSSQKHAAEVRLCHRCVNYPCFEGIDSLETDFAKAGCHGYEQREPKPLNP